MYICVRMCLCACICVYMCVCVRMYANMSFADLCVDKYECVFRNIWSMDRGIGYYLIMLLVNSLFWIAILFIIETKKRTFMEIMGIKDEGMYI